MRTLVAVLVLMVATAGCSNEPEPPTKMDRMVSAMRDFQPTLHSVDRSSLVDFSKMVCSGFGGGMDFGDNYMMLATLGYTPKESGTIMAASVKFRCPQHKDVLLSP